MGRRRGQGGHLTRRASWLFEWREDARDAEGNPVRVKRSSVIAEAAGRTRQPARGLADCPTRLDPRVDKINMHRRR